MPQIKDDTKNPPRLPPDSSPQETDYDQRHTREKGAGKTRGS